MSKVAPPPPTLSPEIDDERLPDNDETPPVSVLVQRTVVIVSSRMRELTVLGGGLLVVIVGIAAFYHYTSFLPHPEKATKFYLLDTVFQLAVALTIMLSAATIGARLSRYFPRGGASRLERALCAYGLGTGVLSLVTALIGLAHGYYFPVLLAELVAPLIIWHRDLVRVMRAIIPMHPRFVLSELRPRSVYEGALFTVCVVLALLIAEHVVVPFWGFDVFMYHFALPQRFLALHHLFGSPGLPQANLPYNNEMLNLLALNFRAEVGAAIVQTVFVGMMLLATFALGVRLISRRVAWLGMAIFATTPIVLYYASSGLIDPHFAFMSLLVMLALLAYRDSHVRRWIILAGLLLGIGVGVKYQIVYLVGPLLVPLCWWCRPVSVMPIAPLPTGPVSIIPTIAGVPLDALPPTPLAAPSSPQQYYLRWLGSVALNMSIIAICALAMFALWAIREWVQVGNPFYPLIFNGAEWTAQRMVYYKSQFDSFGSFQTVPLVRHLLAVVDWLWHWKRYDYSPLPPAPFDALAFVAPLGLFVGTRDARWRQARAGVVLLTWLVIASLLLWGFVDQLVPRYVLPTFGLIALLAAFALDCLIVWLTRLLTRQGRDTVFAAVVAIVLLPGLIFAIQTRASNDPSPVYTGTQSYQSYLQGTQLWQSYWDAVAYFNADVPLDAKVIGVNLNAGYFFKDPYVTPDMNLDIIGYLAEVAPSDAQKLAWLSAHGYRYLIYDRHVTLWAQGRRDTDNIFRPMIAPFESFINRHLILIRSLNGTDVYWIPQAQGTALGNPSA